MTQLTEKEHRKVCPSSTIPICTDKCGPKSTLRLKPSTKKPSSKATIHKFHEVVWLGTSTSSLSLSDIGQSLYSTNSQPSLRKNSLFLTSSLSMMSIGISVMVGRVICSLNSSYSKKRVCQNTIMKQRIPRI